MGKAKKGRYIHGRQANPTGKRKQRKRFRVRKERGGNTYIGDDTPVILPIPAKLPPHGPTKPLLLDIPRLPPRHIKRIVRNQRLGVFVVRIRSTSGFIVVLLGTWLRQRFVVPYALFPGPLAHALERRAEACSVGEGAAVEGHAEDDFVGGDALARVDVDYGVGVEGGAGWAGGGVEEVGLVAGVLVPAAGVVVCLRLLV